MPLKFHKSKKILKISKIKFKNTLILLILNGNHSSFVLKILQTIEKFHKHT